MSSLTEYEQAIREGIAGVVISKIADLFEMDREIAALFHKLIHTAPPKEKV